MSRRSNDTRGAGWIAAGIILAWIISLWLVMGIFSPGEVIDPNGELARATRQLAETSKDLAHSSERIAEQSVEVSKERVVHLHRERSLRLLSFVLAACIPSVIALLMLRYVALSYADPRLIRAKPHRLRAWLHREPVSEPTPTE